VKRRACRPQDHAVDAGVFITVAHLLALATGHVAALEAAVAKAAALAAFAGQELEVDGPALGEGVDGAEGVAIDHATGRGQLHHVSLELDDLQLGARAKAAIRQRAAKTGQPQLQLGHVGAAQALLQDALTVHRHADLPG
jgi:hypothetical protein